MTKPVYPNTFIIGVQKAGTTTPDDWLPAPADLLLWCVERRASVRPARYSRYREKLLMEPTPYKGQPVVLQSAVNYIFYPSVKGNQRDSAKKQNWSLSCATRSTGPFPRITISRKCCGKKASHRSAAVWTCRRSWFLQRQQRLHLYRTRVVLPAD